ncbi:uncharacterized protein LOC141858651 [Brevipalpus obovatus]|uniref:uncharacterized protein LOC141858651 n=1 Tax=Brevipalpus obovatus TaxID=246614 RepID=UPI003D9E73BD
MTHRSAQSSTMSSTRDSNCWICHMNGSEVFCPRCNLGFHIGCGENADEDLRRSCGQFRTTCKQCSRIQESRRRFTSSEHFKKISREKLNSIFDAIITRGVDVPSAPSIMKSEYDASSFRKVCHFINLNNVRSKIRSREYSCTEELIRDLRLIEHAMFIAHGKNYETRKITQYIEQVVKNCRDVDLCPYCVNDCFFQLKGPVSVCPWGHTLVLVDLSEGKDTPFTDFNLRRLEKLPPLVPGKIIGYNPRKDTVNVRLFGSGAALSSEVHLNYVYHLIDLSLNHFYVQLRFMHSKSERKDFAEALKDLELHVKNLKEKFGKRFFLLSMKRNWIPSDGLFIDTEVDNEPTMSPSSCSDSRKSSVSPKISISETNNRPISRSVSQVTKQAQTSTSPVNGKRSPFIQHENSSPKKPAREQVDKSKESQNVRLSSSSSHYEVNQTKNCNNLNSKSKLDADKSDSEVYTNSSRFHVSFRDSDDDTKFSSCMRSIDENDPRPSSDMDVDSKLVKKDDPVLIDITDDDEEDKKPDANLINQFTEHETVRTSHSPNHAGKSTILREGIPATPKKTKQIVDFHPKSDSPRLKLENKADDQNLQGASTIKTKDDVNLCKPKIERLERRISQSLNASCSRCITLEQEIREHERALAEFRVNYEALLKHCTDLTREVEAKRRGES